MTRHLLNPINWQVFASVIALLSQAFHCAFRNEYAIGRLCEKGSYSFIIDEKKKDSIAHNNAMEEDIRSI